MTVVVAKPYALIPKPAGGVRAADIIDRATGLRVGVVIGEHWDRWTGHLFQPDGPSIPVGGVRRHRSEAAGEVWAAHVRASEGASA
jgi:hypothetical protein